MGISVLVSEALSLELADDGDVGAEVRGHLKHSD